MPIWYFWQWALYTLHWRELFPSWGLLWMLGKNIAVDSLQKSNVDKVFACGDATTGASLVVKAMAAGKKTAEAIDRYLK